MSTRRTRISLRARRRWEQAVAREAQRLRWSIVWRGLEAMGILIAIFTSWIALNANWLSWQANNISVQALKDQRVSAAWQMLSMPDGIGRRYALEALVNETDEELVGIDFGCVSSEAGKNLCEHRTYLTGIRLTPASEEDPRKRRLVRVNFRGSDISKSFISDVVFINTKFDDANLIDTTFYYSDFYTTTFSNNIHASEIFQYAIVVTKGDDSNIERKESNYIDMIQGIDNYQYIDVTTGSAEKLAGVNFINGAFKNVTFAGNISRFIFRGCDFSMTSFEEANISKASFMDTPERASTFRNIDISGTVFCEKTQEKQFCVDGLGEEFFYNSYYKAEKPPLGLEMLGVDTSKIATCKEFVRKKEIISLSCDD